MQFKTVNNKMDNSPLSKQLINKIKRKINKINQKCDYKHAMFVTVTKYPFREKGFLLSLNKE